MTVPHWRRSTSPKRLASDALVIGAGIAGVSAALEFQRRGMSVHVIERHTLGAGASCRNAGFLMRGSADHYADACRLYGRDRARRLWKFNEDNLAALRALGAGSLESFRDRPSALIALNEEQEAELNLSLTMLREDGFRVEWLTSGNDTVWRSGHVRTALVNPDDASVNSWELIQLLASKLTRPVIENQEVYAVRPDADSVCVHTPDYEFHAPRVLVCTNAYGPLLFPTLGKLVTPRRGQMIALRFPPSRAVQLSASYYFNHGSEYTRQTPDGTIVFGGCRTYHADRELGYEDLTTPWVQHDIERWATKLLGEGFEVTARWAGTMGFSPDGLPLVGPIPDADPGRERLWFCGGFTGHGMSIGHLTARSAVAAMVDGAECEFRLESRSLAP